MSKMRDKLIHHYFGIDYQIVWEVAREEAPKLRNIIAEILEKEA